MNNATDMNDIHMKKALELAQKGEGYVNPNPLVGAVIVKDGNVVGVGYHKYYGGPHAEVYALEDAKEKAKGADLYVNLEPCSHYGKTPPCAEAVVKAGIKKVFIAMKDPNPLVAGNGIKFLKENGIEVVCGVLEKEALKLNEIFIKYITTRKPFVILKTAMTIDGKIATVTGESQWITGEVSREYVHRVRNKVSGIMVGIGTVLSDDPILTTRLKHEKGRSPAAVIVDSNLRINDEARVLQTIDERKVYVACTEAAPIERIKKLEERGVNIIVTPSADGRVDIKYLIGELGNRGMDSVLLEGGSSLNYSALEAGIVDKVLCFTAPKILGGERAKTPVGGEGIRNINKAILLDDIQCMKVDRDLLIEGYVKKEAAVCLQD